MGGATRYATPGSDSCRGRGVFPPALFCGNWERRTKSGISIGVGPDGPYILGSFNGHSVKLDRRGSHVRFANPVDALPSDMSQRLPVLDIITGFKNHMRSSASSDVELIDFLRKNPRLV